MSHEEEGTMTHDGDIEFKGLKTGVCIKSLNGRVLHQNRYCQLVCGDQLTNTCVSRGCMNLFSPISKHAHWLDGIEVFKSKKLHNDEELYDVAMLKSDSKFVTIFQPLENTESALNEMIESHGLTKREGQILRMILKRSSNLEITNELKISRATLKTHINHINQKIPKFDQSWSR